MSGYTYVDRKLDVTSHNKDYTSVGQCEISIARHSMLGWLPFRVKQRRNTQWRKNLEINFSKEKLDGEV